jgi:hypothetical protein
LLYAVGEVLLIVIGILIALQLESWNSQSERNKHSQQLLKSLLVELQHDYAYFDRYSNAAKKALEEYRSRNEMIYRGITPKDLDTLLSSTLSWSVPVETPRNSFQELIETGLIRELQTKIDSTGLNLHPFLNIDTSNLGRFIISYYNMYDQYQGRVRSNTELLYWMINRDNNIGFKRLYRDYRRSSSENVLYDHPWILDSRTPEYKRMMDMSEGRLIYCRYWIKVANDIMHFNEILEREITKQLISIND